MLDQVKEEIMKEDELKNSQDLALLEYQEIKKQFDLEVQKTLSKKASHELSFSNEQQKSENYSGITNP